MGFKSFQIPPASPQIFFERKYGVQGKNVNIIVFMSKMIQNPSFHQNYCDDDCPKLS